MNKAELTETLCTATGLPQSVVKRALEELLEIIKDEISTRKSVKFQSFGTLKSVETQPKKVRNPVTRQMMVIPRRQTVKFIPSKSLDQVLND